MDGRGSRAGRRHGRDQRLRLVHGRADLDGGRRGLRAANPGFTYTVEGPGTGDGFKKFCAGETDISDASRKIKDKEAATCQAAGIDYVEMKIAYDGMTVMTSPNNTAITCLSFPDLYALIGRRARVSPSGAMPRRSRRSSVPTRSSRTPRWDRGPG